MKRHILTASLLMALTCHGPVAESRPVTYDLLIRGARVLDGTGNPWFAADVAVERGRIAAVGQLDGARGRRVIEAEGLYLTPGFIDIHSHADDGSAKPGEATLRTNDPARKSAPNLVAQGITTVVVNQDGRSPWPILAQRRLLERQGIGPNVMLMVGHGTLRQRVMGDDHRRPATEAEVTAMRALLRRALREGAIGLSAGLEYVPGRWSTTEEVSALVAELAATDGVYISHQRAEGGDPMWFWPSQDPPGPPDLFDALRETIDIGRQTGVKVVASHIKAKGEHYWGRHAEAIQLIEEARAAGVRIWADQYPYPSTGTDGNTVLLPRWAISAKNTADPAVRTPAEVLEGFLGDPETEARIRLDVQHEIRRRGGAGRIVVHGHPDLALVGQTLQQLADGQGVDPVQAAIQLQLSGERSRPGGARLRGLSLDEADLLAFAAQPWVATATDGGIALPADGPVHPRYYGTFPRKLRRYAMELGVQSLADAVRSSTSLPATILGISDRGLIRTGFHADLVLFDPRELEDRATFFDPHQPPAGIRHVLVNGRFVVEDGQVLQSTPGRVLKPHNMGTRGLAVEWRELDALNARLPEAIRVYEGRSEDPALRAWYASVDASAPGIEARVMISDDADGKQTVSDFADGNEVCVVVNAGYFRMASDPATHVGLLVTDGKLISDGDPVITRDGDEYRTARAAIGFDADNRVAIGWASGSRDGVHLWTDPAPNRAGRPVGEEWQPLLRPWPVRSAIGAGPNLLREGKEFITVDEEVFFGTSIPRVHPRTAAGRTVDGKLILMVVDGRQSSSRGVNLQELAGLMASAGAVDALNLDGGGSSTMVVLGERLNRPAGEEREREVASALAINCSALPATPPSA
ncbi:MAG: phosphodiester glycosidase family protein [Steroidobacteraceae bacterium]